MDRKQLIKKARTWLEKSFPTWSDIQTNVAAKLLADFALECGKWVPVEERLPTKRGWYWTTLSNGQVLKTAFYVGAFNRPVIAWMPEERPAPYQPEGGQNVTQPSGQRSSPDDL